METIAVEAPKPTGPRWPNLWQHHLAAQAEAREAILCARGIARRQSVGERTGLSSLTQFHSYGWGRKKP